LQPISNPEDYILPLYCNVLAPARFLAIRGFQPSRFFLEGFLKPAKFVGLRKKRKG